MRRGSRKLQLKSSIKLEHRVTWSGLDLANYLERAPSVTINKGRVYISRGGEYISSVKNLKMDRLKGKQKEHKFFRHFKSAPGYFQLVSNS
jgi:hypothetical protein